jgi:RNA 2',3'-cyclic 3'-phosphodiesterase
MTAPHPTSSGANARGTTLRLFIALMLPDSLKRRLATAQELVDTAARRSAVNLRLTPAHQLHMTLAFLGEVASELLGSIAQTVHQTCAAYAGDTLAPRGLIALPSARRARAIAVEFEEPSGEFARFVASLHGGLRRCGCVVERRAFFAHVTIARLRAPGKMVLDKVDLSVIDQFPAREIALIHSTLKATGAEYRTLSSVTLGTKDV